MFSDEGSVKIPGMSPKLLPTAHRVHYIEALYIKYIIPYVVHMYREHGPIRDIHWESEIMLAFELRSFVSLSAG